MTPVGHHPLVGQLLRSVGASDDEAPSAETRREMQRLDQELKQRAEAETETDATIRDEVELVDGSARDAAEAASQADERASIPTRELTRLYRSFAQLTLPSGDPPGGTGLGLALTKRLWRLYGGTIDVESELGVGPTFTVRIPVA